MFTRLTIDINFTDDVKDKNKMIDKLIDRFQEINTEDIHIHWTSAEWDDVE